jgi:hypothetical protein
VVEMSDDSHQDYYYLRGMPLVLVGENSLCAVRCSDAAAFSNTERKMGEANPKEIELANPRETAISIGRDILPLTFCPKKRCVAMGSSDSCSVNVCFIVGSSRCRCRVVGFLLTKRVNEEK